MSEARREDGPSLSADDPRLGGIRRLVAVMDRLRGPGGCPWDREQTHASLRSFLLEETYEVLEVLDAGDDAKLREELGDLLFQVVFHARIAEEEGRYDFGDVAGGIAEKLLRRHPHVFEPGRAIDDPAKVELAWEEHKKREGRSSVLDGVPPALPALLRAQRVQEKAARIGFDWPDARGPLAKLREEITELEAELEADRTAGIEDELGDLLFSAVNLARHVGLDAEVALRGAVDKFTQRFRRVEAAAGDALRDMELHEMERLWQASKSDQETPGSP